VLGVSENLCDEKKQVSVNRRGPPPLSVSHAWSLTTMAVAWDSHRDPAASLARRRSGG
jgi:hypothetical protein